MINGATELVKEEGAYTRAKREKADSVIFKPGSATARELGKCERRLLVSIKI